MSRSLSAAVITEKDSLWNRPFYSAVFHFGGSVGDVLRPTLLIPWGEGKAPKPTGSGLWQPRPTSSLSLDLQLSGGGI